MAREPSTLHDEVWRDAVGWEGLYKVSSFGRVWSVLRYAPSSRGIRAVGGRMLSSGVRLNTDGSVKHVVVAFKRPGAHRTDSMVLGPVVLGTFVRPAEASERCVHLDGDKKNCRLNNLAWMEHKALHAGVGGRKPRHEER